MRPICLGDPTRSAMSMPLMYAGLCYIRLCCIWPLKWIIIVKPLSHSLFDVNTGLSKLLHISDDIRGSDTAKQQMRLWLLNDMLCVHPTSQRFKSNMHHQAANSKTKNVFKLCRWWIVRELLTLWTENKIIHSIIRTVNDYCLLLSCYLTIYDALLIVHVKIPNQTLTQLLYWSCLFWWRNTDLLSEVTMWSSVMTLSFYWHTLGSLKPTEHLLNVTVL